MIGPPATFLKSVQKPNPKPREPRPAIKRKPVFEPGDCLAIRLSDGDYGAALVLDSPRESKKPEEETYGLNLVGLLNYKSSSKPRLEVFKRRQWLRLTHHSWAGQLEIVYVTRSGFRTYREGFEVVGKIPVRESDPRGSGTYSGWGFAEQVVSQDRWDRGIRDE